METIHWSVDINVEKQKGYPQISEAADCLRNGHVVAFPTETVYGLGADATSDQAVQGIFDAKGRPSDNPLIVHISDTDELSGLVAEVSSTASKLMETFWPGPLTIIFNKKSGVFSDLVTAGLETIGIRMPDHPVALELIRRSGKPLAAPSANTSGKPSPTAAAHVAGDLSGRIAGIVDGGETGVGLESTVIDCTVTPPMILRPGGVSAEDIAACIGEVTTDPSLKKEQSAPRSPGMKYTHYAPTAPLYLLEGETEWIQKTVHRLQQEGKKVGLLASRELAAEVNADVISVCGSRNNPAATARSLYHAIRSFNETDVDIILAESFDENGIGTAIMNRLEKAAGHKWIRQRSS
ncbi:tRNA threonylcarbamoyladenosine biosynthesis protein [Jeotgalibacillus alimentarius]|uniref:Threonylcarbamoyl-AMP synthase n=1 Tax=Jeotgalibacillus alimentarius TaxID=135826 RepID=A0A0C2R148_9BACL|nr:L-threonylcarbamoyladenylate synthase [Jeotgalibacillus alimentarius]KIL44000.1 tRNA threonylcarbamoyladenosine biosynthesis protein [Jeotgalibacillus alimentarius]